MYALIQDSTIVVVYQDLPTIFENAPLDPAAAASVGWVQVTDSPPSFDPTTQSLSRGVPTLNSDGSVSVPYTITNLPPPPAPPVIDPALALQDAKTEAAIALQHAKSNALAVMTYTVGSTAYRVTLSTQDQVDVQTMLTLLQAQPAGSTIDWEIVDGDFLTWGLADLQALQQAGIAHFLGCYSNAAALTSAINAATTISQIPDVTQGWPP